MSLETLYIFLNNTLVRLEYIFQSSDPIKCYFDFGTKFN